MAVQFNFHASSVSRSQCLTLVTGAYYFGSVDQTRYITRLPVLHIFALPVLQIQQSAVRKKNQRSRFW